MSSQTLFDFQCDVLELSHDFPVLVDFWAEWCAPCRMLTPLLEKMAEKGGCRWKLVKINTEEHPDLASHYKVKSIPNVKLFVKGQVQNEFSGAMPESELALWLKKNIPSPYEKEIALASECMSEGNPVMATSLLEGVLHNEPDNLPAAALLVRLRLFLHPLDAIRLSEQLEIEPEYAQFAETVRSLGRLLSLEHDRLPPDEVRADYLAAIAQLKEEHFDGALEGFIGVLKRNRAYDDDGSRKACIAIFRFLGEEHEITLKHRRAFDRAF
ncbi:MAG: tetratricopeptide repeat protein [Chlorobiaceae bacterium]